MSFNLFGILLAATIFTEEWGNADHNIITNPAAALPSAVASYNTPGSDDATNLNHRLIAPAYYAVLDGYETRAFASTRTTFPTNKPSALRRLLYFSSPDYQYAATTNISFLYDTNQLRNGALRPHLNRGAFCFWGSDILDYIFANEYNAPAYADFDFQTNIISLIWGPSTQNRYIRFCPSYFQLQSSNIFPMRPDGINYATNPFQNMLNINGFGEECYWSEPSSRKYFGWDNVVPLNRTFENVVSASFATNYAEQVTNTSRRLLIPSLAAADQCLALHQKSYFIEPPRNYLNNIVRGDACVQYAASGSASAAFSFDYTTGEATVDSRGASFNAPSQTTNVIVKRDIPYTIPAPAQALTRISPAYLSSSIDANPTNAHGSAIFCSLDDVTDALDAVFADNGGPDHLNVNIHFTGDFDAISFSASAEGSATHTSQNWIGRFSGSESFSAGSIPVSAWITFSYDYIDAINNLGHFSGVPAWDSCCDHYAGDNRYYLFSSFVTSSSASTYTSKTLRHYLFQNYTVPDDYGFRCHSYDYELGPEYLNEAILYELDLLIETCLDYTGETFFQNAAAYMGVSQSSARAVLACPIEWSAQIGVHHLEYQYEIYRRFNGHEYEYSIGPSFAPTSIQAAYAYPMISGAFDTSELHLNLPRAKAIETYLGVLTETTWKFPQVKFD